MHGNDHLPIIQILVPSIVLHHLDVLLGCRNGPGNQLQEISSVELVRRTFFCFPWKGPRSLSRRLP